MKCPRCGKQATYNQGVRWFCNHCNRCIGMEQTVMPTTLPPLVVRHNANPSTSALRTLRRFKALLPAARRLVEQAERLVAECEVHLAVVEPAELPSEPTDPETAELLADGFVNVGPRKVEP